MSHGDRVRAAAASFGIARDHHGSIVHLMKWSLHSSSFALLRGLFEAYVRGLWLRHCATEQQIDASCATKQDFLRRPLLKSKKRLTSRTASFQGSGVKPEGQRATTLTRAGYTFSGGDQAAGSSPCLKPPSLRNA
jgi:hypothetical protein